MLAPLDLAENGCPCLDKTESEMNNTSVQPSLRDPGCCVKHAIPKSYNRGARFDWTQTHTHTRNLHLLASK